VLKQKIKLSEELFSFLSWIYPADWTTRCEPINAKILFSFFFYPEFFFFGLVFMTLLDILYTRLLGCSSSGTTTIERMSSGDCSLAPSAYMRGGKCFKKKK
jgi:hypothetical protein